MVLGFRVGSELGGPRRWDRSCTCFRGILGGFQGIRAQLPAVFQDHGFPYVHPEPPSLSPLVKVI